MVGSHSDVSNNGLEIHGISTKGLHYAALPMIDLERTVVNHQLSR